MISFVIERATGDELSGHIISDNEGDPKQVEFLFHVSEDENGVHLTVSGFADGESHKLLEASAPMEAYR